ncbi:MAG: type II secretion system protein M [Deltaproteobacteria bacterium]|nr:type II secretion system protein M [Deltaproteobacteria bacterium]
MWSSKSLFAWQDRYHSLTRREQSSIIVGLVLVLSFLLIYSVYFPMNDRLNRLESSVKIREDDLSELRTIVAQYKRLEKSREDSKGKGQVEDFNLFSVLEKLATKNGLMDKIDYMKPGSLQLDDHREEKWVEAKFSQITLKEFTSYLYDLQSFGKGIYIKRLFTRKEGEYLNLILQPAVVRTKSSNL